MSEFHYVRTRGEDGGVDACEGPAIGLDLETVLKDGLPPWNVALEIVAALCEILDIADQDGEVHGEVHPKYVFIDETGAVSLEGFGIKRRKCRAPEGVPKDTRSDLYGLGYVAYRCFCSHELPETVPTEQSAHDDLIVDAALEIDLSGVSPAIQGDVQWYVAKFMDFDPAQRPSALDGWRTFVAFANATQSAPDSVDMAEWCAAALDGGGARRKEKKGGLETAPTPVEDEELGGPVLVKGGIAARINFDEPGSVPKAGATAFWTKEDMKRALDRQEETPAGGVERHSFELSSNFGGGTAARGPSPRSIPPTGGGSATSFWTQDQLDAMARGDENAPRPRRAEGEGERRRVTAAQRPPGSGPASSGPPSLRLGTGPLPSSRPGSGPPSMPVRSAPRPSGPPSVSNVPPGSLSNPGVRRAPPPPSTTFQPNPIVAASAAGTATAPVATVPSPAPQPVRAGQSQAAVPTQRFEFSPEEQAQFSAARQTAQANPSTGPLQPGLGLNPAPKRAAPEATSPLPSSAAPSKAPSRTPGAPPPRPTAQPPRDPAKPEEAGGSGGLTFVLFSGGIAAVAVVVGGVLLAALLLVVLIVSWPSSPPEPTPLPIQPVPSQPAPQPADTQPEPQPVPEPTPEPTPKDRAEQPKPSPKPTPPPKPRPQPAPATPQPPPPVPAPQPAPSPSVRPRPRPTVGTGNAQVTIKSASRGAVNSCVTSKVTFNREASFEIEAYQLPATCLVKIDGANGVFQVYGSGEINCDKQGTVVTCDRQQVP